MVNVIGVGEGEERIEDIFSVFYLGDEMNSGLFIERENV